jgi:ketosteroid isomerase-like protein
VPSSSTAFATVLLASSHSTVESEPIEGGSVLGAMHDRAATASNLTLEQFRAVFVAGNEAFNRGDFATAFAGLAPDCEWHLWDAFFAGTVGAETRVLVGRDQVRRFFEREIHDAFPDFHDEPVRFLQAGDGVFVVLHQARGTGRVSGAPIGVDHGQIWELRGSVPVRVREFSVWEDALSAAGLDPSIADEIRRAEQIGG